MIEPEIFPVIFRHYRLARHGRGMIDEQLRDQANAFLSEWSELFEAFPRYVPQICWASVGIFDLIARRVRGKRILDHEDEHLIHGLSCALGCLTYDTWARLPGRIDIEATFEDSDRDVPDVFVRARGGDFTSSGEAQEVNISRTLRSALLVRDRNFPFFERSERYIHEQGMLLPALMLGILSGRTPHAEGVKGQSPWMRCAPSDFAPYMVAVNNTCAASLAEQYQGYHPAEKRGAKDILYQRGLVLPPMFHAEAFPGMNAVVGLLSALSKGRCPASERNEVLKNLCRSADETSASAAFALACALAKEPSEDLILLSESKGIDRVTLRPAVILARRGLERPDNWITLISEGRLAEAQALYVAEQQLGLIPYARLKPQMLAQPNLSPLFFAMSWSRLDEIADFTEFYTHQVHADVEVLLQGIFAFLFNGDYERADDGLTILRGRIEELPADQVGVLSELEGHFALVIGDSERAVEHLQHAVAATDLRRDSFVAASLNLAQALASLSRFPEALKVLERVERSGIPSFAAKVNQAQILQHLGRFEEAQAYTGQLYQCAPMNPAVFELVCDERKSRIPLRDEAAIKRAQAI